MNAFLALYILAQKLILHLHIKVEEDLLDNYAGPCIYTEIAPVKLEYMTTAHEAKAALTKFKQHGILRS